MERVAPKERRTGLLVPVRAAEPLVGRLRRRHHAESVARRIPPHVTVLFPFARADAVDDDLRCAVAAHFSGLARFEADLLDVGSFDDCAWLGLRPHDRWVSLLRSTWERFPAFPPYERPGLEPAPHLTIASAGGPYEAREIAARARLELGPGLPLGFEVDVVSLFEEQPDGTWDESTTFPLG